MRTALRPYPRHRQHQRSESINIESQVVGDWKASAAILFIERISNGTNSVSGIARHGDPVPPFVRKT